MSNKLASINTLECCGKVEKRRQLFQLCSGLTHILVNFGWLTPGLVVMSTCAQRGKKTGGRRGGRKGGDKLYSGEDEEH